VPPTVSILAEGKSSSHRSRSTRLCASLSAILLDNDYYAFIMAGRKESDGLPWVGEDRLIPAQGHCLAGTHSTQG